MKIKQKKSLAVLDKFLAGFYVSIHKHRSTCFTLHNYRFSRISTSSFVTRFSRLTLKYSTVYLKTRLIIKHFLITVKWLAPSGNNIFKNSLVITETQSKSVPWRWLYTWQNLLTSERILWTYSQHVFYQL